MSFYTILIFDPNLKGLWLYDQSNFEKIYKLLSRFRNVGFLDKKIVRQKDIRQNDTKLFSPIGKQIRVLHIKID